MATNNKKWWVYKPGNNTGGNTGPQYSPAAIAGQNALLQYQLDSAKQSLIDALAGGYGSSSGSGSSGPSQAEIDAKWNEFNLQRQGINTSGVKDQQDLQNALASLGIKTTDANQQSTQQLQQLLSGAAQNGSITSLGYQQNQANVGNQLQNALGGIGIQKTAAQQAYDAATAERARQLALIQAQQDQYNAQVAQAQAGSGGGGGGGGGNSDVWSSYYSQPQSQPQASPAQTWPADQGIGMWNDPSVYFGGY